MQQLSLLLFLFSCLTSAVTYIAIDTTATSTLTSTTTSAAATSTTAGTVSIPSSTTRPVPR